MQIFEMDFIYMNLQDSIIFLFLSKTTLLEHYHYFMVLL